MNPFASLPEADLRAQAKALVGPGRWHWSLVAGLLGAIEDRGTFTSWGFRSLRAFAESELDLAPDEVAEAIRLYRLMQGAPVPFERWRELPKAKALVIAQAVALGGDVEIWIDRAVLAASAQELRDALARQTGAEIWVPRSFSLPEETGKLLDAAMVLAVGELVEEVGHPALEEAQRMVTDRRWAHRLLEALAKTYIERNAKEAER